MDPMRDLRGVADLIEEAFAEDLDHSGQSALQELRWLSRIKPVLWWMVYSNPEHTDFLSGFVWEEDRKIVGNITINRNGAGSRRWLISNLAVSRNYRRRGIARGLMYAALELVNEYSGSMVSLQVRADNESARRLYDDLQFKEISGNTQLWAATVPAVSDLPLPPAVVFRPRRFDMADAKEAYHLANVATPISVQKEWPIRQSQFRLSSSEHVNNFFRRFKGGGATAYWVVEDGQRFVATVDVQPATWRNKHQVSLTVHPDWRGVLERPLISRALAYLQPWAGRGISIRHPVYHPEAIEAYKALGLTEKQTLLWMKRDM
ncbi:MAG: hypothetical protein Kow0031_17930 [Anaerolineae bacterium]